MDKPAGIRQWLLGMIALVLLLDSLTAAAQFSANRAVQRAININVRNAMQRVQLSLRVKDSAGKVVRQETSRNGRYLLLVFEDNRPRVWDLHNSRYWDQFDALDSPITAAAIGGDMSFVTLQTDGSIARWGADSRAPKSMGKTPLREVQHVELGRTGDLIVVDGDGLIYTYSEGLARLGGAYANLNASTTAMAMDPSGDVLATSINANSLQLWSSRTGAPIADITLPGSISAFSFGEESSQLLLATEGAVVDWNTRESQLEGEYPCPGACRISRLLVNSASSSIIAVNDDASLLRWNLGAPGRGTRFNRNDEGFSAVSTPAAAPLLIGGNTRGLVQFSHLERPGAELTLVSTSRGWAMIDPLGRFDGQAGEDIGVSWADDSVEFPLPSFVETHFEPGLFSKWLRADNEFATDPKALSEGVLAPPRIAMSLTPPAPDDPQQLIEVQVKLTDTGGGLGTPSLYHLGLRVSQEKLVDRSSTVESDRRVSLTTWKVRALPGENTFTARVRDTDGIVSPARVDSVQVAGAPSDPALHLFAIAIDDYDDEELNLDYSIADADAVLARLARQAEPLFSEVFTTAIKNREATRSAVVDAIRGLRDAKPEDVIVIYAATHGDVFDDKFHLLLQGLRAPVTRQNARRVGLAFDEIAAELEQLDARRVILLLDTCKSGDALADLQNEFRDRRALQSFSNLLGVHMIAATAKGQLATESSVLGHGVFTYSLIEGLGGGADEAPKDGLLTASELALFAEAGVPALSARYAAFPQWPTVYSRGFDFSVAAPPSVEPSATQDGVR